MHRLCYHLLFLPWKLPVSCSFHSVVWSHWKYTLRFITQTPKDLCLKSFLKNKLEFDPLARHGNPSFWRTKPSRLSQLYWSFKPWAEVLVVQAVQDFNLWSPSSNKIATFNKLLWVTISSSNYFCTVTDFVVVRQYTVDPADFSQRAQWLLLLNYSKVTLKIPPEHSLKLCFQTCGV